LTVLELLAIECLGEKEEQRGLVKRTHSGHIDARFQEAVVLGTICGMRRRKIGVRLYLVGLSLCKRETLALQKGLEMLRQTGYLE
jgi:hypothetical protein